MKYQYAPPSGGPTGLTEYWVILDGWIVGYGRKAGWKMLSSSKQNIAGAWTGGGCLKQGAHSAQAKTKHCKM